MIEAPPGSGIIGLNSAAARLAMPGDKIIIAAYALFDEAEAKAFKPRVVRVGRENRILSGLELLGGLLNFSLLAAIKAGS
ncbi:hypothetical protein GCM10007857_83800 [Bradyrhizobium iriomotense]|uniref:Aspartate 1-decarboxylase n=1 Tax=Bradyrhizobium iriomotense TaxID=441950 RepID=A0ABQ6BBA5_9BRAD|nr:hypothetical protein GCM10007857_83800 [Bradyrhizobium iriomotense]